MARELGVGYDRCRKAIHDGRLVESARPELKLTKSERSAVDAAAGMGVGCTRVPERGLATMGQLAGAASRFETCMDVPNAGVLCALAALLVNGSKQFLGELKGDYTSLQVLLVLALMALCRVKSAEKLRGHAPGEFGKLLGLERAPEVRCLRQKMDELSAQDGAERWAAHLSAFWMQQDPQAFTSTGTCGFSTGKVTALGFSGKCGASLASGV